MANPTLRQLMHAKWLNFDKNNFVQYGIIRTDFMISKLNALPDKYKEQIYDIVGHGDRVKGEQLMRSHEVGRDELIQCLTQVFPRCGENEIESINRTAITIRQFNIYFGGEFNLEDWYVHELDFANHKLYLIEPSLTN